MTTTSHLACNDHASLPLRTYLPTNLPHTKYLQATKLIHRVLLWYIGTLSCLISMLHAYLFFGKFSQLHGLLGPTRLLILGENSCLHY